MEPCYNYGPTGKSKMTAHHPKKSRYQTILALASPLLFACQFLAVFQSSAAGNVLFQDDFSQANSGWSQAQLTQGSTGYSEGGYKIYVNEPHTEIWGYPGLHFKDTRIEGEAAKASGLNDNIFGVICRYQEGKGFYAFLISSDGYYGIARYQDGRFDMLGAQAMPPTEKIRQGNASNHLRADCAGTRLALYVNGEMLIEQEDKALSSGDIGLIAGALDTPGAEIWFDNFTALVP